MSRSIFETDIWPCMCPDMFWALEDSIEHVATLVHNDSDSIEYSIDTRGLPHGKTVLHTFTGLRDITIHFSEWSTNIAQKITQATLILQDRAIQTVEKKKYEDTLTFSIFSHDHFLPLFAIDKPLLIRIELIQDMTPMEQMDLPRTIGHCKGLFFRVKEYTRPMFIAGCPQSVLTWNGSSLMILQKASEDQRTHVLPKDETRKSYFDQDTSDEESFDFESLVKGNSDLEDVAHALGILESSN